MRANNNNQAVLLVSALLILCFSNGSGRKMMVETFGLKDTSISVSLEEKAREMVELDYVDAGPNYNARGGNLFTPSPPPPPPPLLALPPSPPPFDRFT